MSAARKSAAACAALHHHEVVLAELGLAERVQDFDEQAVGRLAVRDDDRFCGFIFYETYCFLEYRPDGTVAMKPDFNVGEAMEAARG